MPLPSDTEPQVSVVRAPFPVPYGLFVALGVYALLVLGYTWATYWRSPAYQAAEHFAEATQLLGVDDGRKVDAATLERAAVHFLDAARLAPEVKFLHQRVEAMRFRFDERGFKLPRGYVQQAERLSEIYTQLENERAPLLVVGVRDRGWAPDQLLAGPGKVFLWSLLGAGLVILVWAYLRFSGRAVHTKVHEERLKATEDEVQRLGEYRNRPPRA
jgi:hypothetical protein